jgi:hypothetical protein
MTVTHHPAPPKTSIPSPGVTAAFGFIVYVLAVIAGDFFEINADHRLPHHQDQSLWEVLTGFWAEFAIALIGVAIVVWAGRRACSGPTARLTRTALVLGVVGVLSVPAFWAGWPNVFGAVALGLALESRQRLGSLGPMAGIAAALGTLGFITGTVICLLG